MLSIIEKLVYQGFEVFGRYYSKYPGYVASNDDPEGMCRVQLKVPMVYGDQVYTQWAYPTGIFSGEGYGSQVTPQVGDMVWVEFRQGDPKKPVWSYGYFKKGAKPKQLRDIKNFWFKTPKGHLVELDDNDDIRITHKDGSKVIIKKDSISLVNSTGVSLGSENSSSQPAILGTNTQLALIQESTRVTALASQLVVGVSSATDLATLKAAIISAATPIPEQAPDYSNILSSKVTLD